MSTPIPPGRPRPLDTIARRWSQWLAVLLGVASTAATVGMLNADQAAGVTNTLTALDVAFGAIVGVVTAVSSAAGAFRVARRGAAVVTPLSSPRDNTGRRLVPAAGPPPARPPLD